MSNKWEVSCDNCIYESLSMREYPCNECSSYIKFKFNKKVLIKEIKTTAYHECIEKIKKRAEHSSCSVAVNTIADNVLKELEGENNG